MNRIALIAFLFAFQAHAAEEYWGVEKKYTTADVLSILGKPKKVQPRPPLNFSGQVKAGISTSVDCGKITTNVDIDSISTTLKEIPKELDNLKNVMIDKLPLLTLCYMSPSWCAEIKNLNFRIDQRLGLLTDTCYAIDNYIDSQSTADEVMSDAERRGWRKCVSDKRKGAHPLPMHKAMEECKLENKKLLYADIAKAWTQAIYDKDTPQKVIESILTAISINTHSSIGERKYKFLSAILGELTIDVNGELLPVFPAKPMTAGILSDQMMDTAIHIACDQVLFEQAIDGTLAYQSNDPEVQFYEDRLFKIIKTSCTGIDHENLFGLDTPDREAMCNALGRSFAKDALLKTAADGESLATTALQNPALPEAVRDMYEDRVTRVFAAMRSQSESIKVKPIDTLREILTKMAKIQREIRRDIANIITEQRLKQHRNQQECDSDLTCE